jgi:hypothetical protein
MGYPVVYQKGDAWVGLEVESFAGCGVCGHYYDRVRAERGRGEVGVVHEGDVGSEVGAGCEMELYIPLESR